jgi:hypothetical protein
MKKIYNLLIFIVFTCFAHGSMRAAACRAGGAKQEDISTLVKELCGDWDNANIVGLKLKYFNKEGGYLDRINQINLLDQNACLEPQGEVCKNIDILNRMIQSAYQELSEHRRRSFSRYDESSTQGMPVVSRMVCPVVPAVSQVSVELQSGRRRARRKDVPQGLMPKINWNHLERGELVLYGDDAGDLAGTVNVTGVHVKGHVGIGKIIKKPDGFGTYQAEVQIFDPASVAKYFKGLTLEALEKKVTKRSTFFPDSWSKEKVLAKIEQAYRNPVSEEIKRQLLGSRWDERKIIGATDEGMYIEMYLSQYSDGDFYISTAYPMHGLSEQAPAQIDLSNCQFDGAFVIALQKINGIDHVIVRRQGSADRGFTHDNWGAQNKSDSPDAMAIAIGDGRFFDASFVTQNLQDTIVATDARGKTNVGYVVRLLDRDDRSRFGNAPYAKIPVSDLRDALKMGVEYVGDLKMSARFMSLFSKWLFK